MDAELDRTGRAPQGAGQLPVGQARGPAQDQHLALFGRQPLQRLVDDLALLTALEPFVLDRRQGRSLVLERADRLEALPRRSPVVQEVAGDRIHPGVEPTSVAEGVTELQDAEEHVLGGILAGRRIAAHAKEEGEQAIPVPLEQGPQTVQVATANGGHELEVGR